MKKSTDGFISFDPDDLDPDVDAAISAGKKRQVARRNEEAGKPASSPARRSPGASKKVEKDKARNRRMIDLPEDLEAQLVQIADELSVPVSSLIVWLVDRGMQFTSIDDIRDAREPSRSMRFEFILRPPPPQEKKPRKRG